MSSIYISPNKIEDSSKKIKELSLRYDNLIVKFYNRINGINKKTNEWSGSDAENYIAYINSFKSSYEEIGKIMKKYTQVLDNINSKAKSISSTNNMQ